MTRLSVRNGSVSVRIGKAACLSRGKGGTPGGLGTPGGVRLPALCHRDQEPIGARGAKSEGEARKQGATGAIAVMQ